VVVSIFINPTQFAPHEDLEAYPRDSARDLELLAEEGAHLVWIPDAEEMYPQDFQTWIEVDEVSRPLEGIYRPGHFRGVTTVVAKLFNAAAPHKAYFGQKDAQQAAVIQQMARDLNFELEVKICPVVREPDGLAMSSRNSYLDPEERRAAAILFKALSNAQTAFNKGERSADLMRNIMMAALNSEPLADPQYVSCSNPDTLLELTGQIDDRALLSTAVFIGKTRLIDNIILEA
jgi:pantoate--beta-alanine ligase